MKNYYQTLGVSPSATPEEIKAAFKNLSKKVHPDMNLGNNIFEELFKNVNEAYQVLGDEIARRAYNDRYNSFFFSSGMHSDNAEAFTRPITYNPAGKNLKGKFMINGAISLCLMFVFMGVNAFIDERDEIMPANQLVVAPSVYTKKEVTTKPINRAQDKKENIPQVQHIESLEILKNEVAPQPNNKTHEALVAIKLDQPVVLKNATKSTSENLPTDLKNNNHQLLNASLKTNKAKLIWSEDDMLDVVEKVMLLKTQVAAKATTIRLLQSANSNITNAFGVASYLQINSFSIAGRLTTSKNTEGVQIDFDGKECIIITIGLVK